MVKLKCLCLNVSVHLNSPPKDRFAKEIASLINDQTTIKDILVGELGVAGIAAEQDKLVVIRKLPRGGWRVWKCFNCGTDVCAADPVKPNIVYINSILQENPDITKPQPGKIYSPTFKMFIDETNREAENSLLTGPADSDQSAQQAFSKMQRQLDVYLKEEERQMDARIKAFIDEQQQLIKETQTRAYRDRKILWHKINAALSSGWSGAVRPSTTGSSTATTPASTSSATTTTSSLNVSTGSMLNLPSVTSVTNNVSPSAAAAATAAAGTPTTTTLAAPNSLAPSPNAAVSPSAANAAAVAAAVTPQLQATLLAPSVRRPPSTPANTPNSTSSYAVGLAQPEHSVSFAETAKVTRHGSGNNKTPKRKPRASTLPSPLSKSLPSRISLLNAGAMFDFEDDEEGAGSVEHAIPVLDDSASEGRESITSSTGIVSGSESESGGGATGTSISVVAIAATDEDVEVVDAEDDDDDDEEDEVEEPVVVERKKGLDSLINDRYLSQSVPISVPIRAGTFTATGTAAAGAAAAADKTRTAERNSDERERSKRDKQHNNDDIVVEPLPPVELHARSLTLGQTRIATQEAESEPRPMSVRDTWKATLEVDVPAELAASFVVPMSLNRRMKTFI